MKVSIICSTARAKGQLHYGTLLIRATQRKAVSSTVDETEALSYSTSSDSWRWIDSQKYDRQYHMHRDIDSVRQRSMPFATSKKDLSKRESFECARKAYNQIHAEV
jgi:hypothetical protein